ncbi:MAG: UbiA family prenyltransferase [Candidatus Omnitrophica bacterium]|nr:UbiA family prenyltransferase [Candidatus Omnitrophota bacterium]
MLFIVPFFFQMISGFIHNTLCDCKVDPDTKNPIKTGGLPRKKAIFLVFIFTFLSVASFLLVSRSVWSILAFLAYCLLWFFYNGFKLRLKETLAGPLAASLGLFAGAPLILIINYSSISLVTVCLFLGILFCFTGHEILHTITDYDFDSKSGCKTFSVRLGVKSSRRIKLFVDLIGVMFLTLGFYLSESNGLLQIKGIAVFFSCLMLVALLLDRFFNQNSPIQKLYSLIREILLVYSVLIFK